MGKKRILYLFLASLLALNIATNLPAGAYQQGSPDDSTRDFWNSKFLKKRPKAKTAAQATKKAHYHKAKEKDNEQARELIEPTVQTQNNEDFSVLGLTLWKLRPARPAENNVRLFTHKKKNPKQLEGLTPERVEA